jgi:acyl-CoA synthetase (AMP-forming)/AMP-acid ligase II/acyl carrier protein
MSGRDQVSDSTQIPDMALAALFDGGSASSPAILAPGRSPLNHDGLRREIDRTADALRRYGTRRGNRIALVLPDGPDAAVCFLGVAAVAACAPLNPRYREAEFAFFLEDLEPAAVIVPAGYDSPVRAVAARLRIPIGELSPDLTGPAGSFELVFGGSPIASGTNGGASADDIALVLHTSGTTARPKMVPLTRRNLCASAGNIARTLLLTAADRGLVVMPLFHIHGLVAGVLAPLSAGGSIVCTPGFVATQFFDAIDDFAPTWYTAVPTMHRAIVSRARDHADVLARRQLRFIRASSAPLPPTLMAELEAAFRAPVIEAYGMTEASHQIASNPLPPEPRKPGSVGRPAGVEIGILNEQGVVHVSASNQPQDGEVVIRGAPITVGYSGPHDTNSDAFHDGWFRTGDLGRFDTDGYLFLRGRSKEIINRGGEKISPLEIDEVLLNHPAVDAAVTFAIPDSVLGEDIGVAVVVRKGAALAEEDLLAFASSRLADFKIPRRIVFLQDLPKGPTGKVQRRGLAHSLGIDGTAVAAQPRSYVEPRSDTERKLAAIWQDTLRVRRVGRHDAFLDLGGDSRLATEIILRVVATFGVTLPVYELFGSATLERVADAIERLPPAEEAVLSPIVAASRARALPLSSGQERIWFLTRFEAAGSAYHHLIAIRLRGRLSVNALRDSIQAVVDRHEVLRTVYAVGDRFLPLQSVARDSTLQFTVERRLDVPPDRRDALAPAIAGEAVRQPIDLSRELPLRARIVEFAPDDHLLVVSVHHIAFDGWSESIFTRELSAAYAACLRGTPLTLPPLPIQYGDFAQWHRQHSGSGPRAAEHLRYWNARLRGAPSLLALPTDYPRPAERTFTGRVTRLDVPQSLAADLRRLARAESATLYMLLLTAFQWLLAERSGQTDILVGTPVAGRTRAEIEPLIGFFVNTLVMRADLSAADTFRQLLRQVRDSTIDAIAHQETPFERVIEALAPPRTLSFTPVFQVMFQLRNIPEPTIALADVEAQWLRPDPGTAPFDVSLDVVENEHGLGCMLTFDTALFAGATAALLLADYRRTLEAIAANVDAPI